MPLSEEALMKAIELNGVQVGFNKSAFNWGRYCAHDTAAVAKLATPATVIEFKRTQTLEEIIAKRVELLTAYQDAAYAKQYSDFVAQVQAAEGALGSKKLTEAVARYFYKLMAYKDEYEVARLHSDPAFRAKIEGMFEGDYKVKFHLAPPLLAKKKDKEGHLVKQEFGPWMLKAFGVLAKFKGLRGSALGRLRLHRGAQDGTRPDRRIPQHRVRPPGQADCRQPGNRRGDRAHS